jgi:PGF-CTERM protein
VNANVSVDLDASFYDSLADNESATLTATVYHDDGDGTFAPGADRLVTAGGTAVASTFEVTKVPNADRTTSIVVTATGTTVPAATTTDDATAPADDPADSATDPTDSGETPGFGALATAAAALAAALALARRRR